MHDISATISVLADYMFIFNVIVLVIVVFIVNSSVWIKYCSIFVVVVSVFKI